MYATIIYGKAICVSSHGSSRWKSVSARWPPIRRPSCICYVLVRW